MMRRLDLCKQGVVCVFLFVIVGVGCVPVFGETLVYDNSSTNGSYTKPGSGIEFADYGTSSGGNVVKFSYGYASEQSNPGTLRITFYEDVDGTTDPDSGYYLAHFDISGLSGNGTYYRDFDIPINEQFNLPSGDFGYSYRFMNDNSGPVIAWGGSGNQDEFWAYDGVWDEWYLTWFGGNPHAGFYMKVYIGTTPTGKCNIEGYKFDDADQDGFWDGGEIGLAGWTIYLDLDDDGQYDINEPNAVTASDGYYLFGNLEPGTYKVAEVQQGGWVQTLPGGVGTYTIAAAADQTYSDKNFGNGLASGYCAAWGGCDEYITDVVVGTINNVGTGCDGYADYTAMSTTMEIGTGYPITVTNGLANLAYEEDQCGIWVDWNQDGDFTDADPNETIALDASSDPNFFTATITPPAGALAGDTGMRVRILYTGEVNPCGPSEYGEVEDYTITIASAGPPTRIYGKKWHDLNDNGQMDGGEAGLSGWTIFLDDDRDGEVDPCEITTVTDSEGDYEFRGMVAGEYYNVSEEDQNGWINTYPGAGGIHYRVWVEDNNDAEANFGNYLLHNGDVNGYKFHDLNNNGVWDGGEGPLSGWEIYIDENENGEWDSGEPKTTTDSSGYYEFTNLAPGYYNILEVSPPGWFQTYPGITSGRLWGLEGRGGEGSMIAEVNLDTMTIENRFTAPFDSMIMGIGCLAAGPSSLFYCPFKYVDSETFDILFFEFDSESGLLIDQGELDLPSDEISWDAAWHDGLLYVVSAVTPLPPSPQLPETYLNRYDPFTKELISRDQLVGVGCDGLASDPYEDKLLINLLIKWMLYEIDPLTGNVDGTIGQQLVVGPDMAYTNGMLYKTFSGRDDIHTLSRHDGSLVTTQDISGYAVGFDSITGGIGCKGGHRVWIGKADVGANFGNRLNSEGSLSGIKYEDMNGNGERDAGEPGMSDWEIFVDLDGDMDRDPCEPLTVTDANGNWLIEGLEYGQYFVREVQQKGFTSTEPGQGWKDVLEIDQPRDIVFDDLRNVLYISTAAGNVERFDLGTGQFLSPVVVGGSLSGMDITADNRSLYVADTQLSGGNGVVHKINLNTLSVTDLTYSVDTGEDSSYDIAIGSEGIALVTGSGLSVLSLYVLDTNTDTITVRPDVLGHSTINGEARVVRSYDRSKIWLINNSSNGWIVVYDSPSDTFIAEKSYYEYLYESPVALNRDGSLAGIQVMGHMRIVDADFNLVTGLEDSKMAAVFDSSRNLFYQFQLEGSTLYSMDTVLWELADYSDIGFVTDIYSKFVNGETAITGDGRIVGVTKADGVVLIRREYRRAAFPGRNISGIDFGNKTLLCGDIDGDRDVDLWDLGYLSEDWLLSELSLDIVPTVRDHVVNMPDFSRFAEAWQSSEGSANWDAVCDVAPGGGDDSVDIKDFLVLSEEWLLEGARYDSDVAGVDGPDGFVNLYDFTCLAGDWWIFDNIIYYDEDFETGVLSNLPWEHAGDGSWAIDPVESFEGSYSVKSADLANNEECILRVTVDCGEGTMYFMLKNENGGALEFRLDGEYLYGYPHGDMDWTLIPFPVSAGTHTFEWTFISGNLSHAWIDAIRFPPVGGG